MIPLLLTILGAIIIVPIINRTGSLMSGRQGVRLLQPLYSVSVLFHKGSVRSDGASVVSSLAPSVMLGSLLAASLLIPFGNHEAIISFRGDLILFCTLLAVSRVVMVWAAMDAGSSFQGMGASRDAFFSMLVEPAFLLLFATLALITGRDSMSAIFAQFENMSLNLLVLSIVVGYGFFKILLVDTGRVPLGDPATHLELTMTHEVMVLDLSGVDLAFFTISGWVKTSIFTLLVANSLIPAHVVGWMLIALYLLVALVVGVTIGVIESFKARNRMNKNSTYIASISAVGLLAFIMAYMLLTNQLI